MLRRLDRHATGASAPALRAVSPRGYRRRSARRNCSKLLATAAARNGNVLSHVAVQGVPLHVCRLWPARLRAAPPRSHVRYHAQARARALCFTSIATPLTSTNERCVSRIVMCERLCIFKGMSPVGSRVSIHVRCLAVRVGLCVWQIGGSRSNPLKSGWRIQHGGVPKRRTSKPSTSSARELGKKQSLFFARVSERRCTRGAVRARIKKAGLFYIRKISR